MNACLGLLLSRRCCKVEGRREAHGKGMWLLGLSLSGRRAAGMKVGRGGGRQRVVGGEVGGLCIKRGERCIAPKDTGKGPQSKAKKLSCYSQNFCRTSRIRLGHAETVAVVRNNEMGPGDVEADALLRRRRRAGGRRSLVARSRPPWSRKKCALCCIRTRMIFILH